MIGSTAGLSTGATALLPSLQNIGSTGVDATEQRMEKVGEELEGVFVSMLLKEMRNSLEDGLFGQEGSDTYGGMFDMFIGQHLADSKPLGISDVLLNQYRQNQKSAEDQSASNPVEEAFSKAAASVDSGTSFTA
ncbi:MAG: rod-binding protein [Pirellulaceae bacterium]